METSAPQLGHKTGLKFFKKDFYMVTAPWWMRRLFPGCTWDFKTGEKTIYLSFDDGPHPEITPFVLQELKKYDAKATFFCIGDNVRRYPEVYQQIIEAGHTVGNHTMHHINGWKSTDEAYLDDIKQAGVYIRPGLFRPPYGRIKRSQVKKLTAGTGKDEQVYQIIMWSVLAGDWDVTITPQKCLERVKNAVYPGCIIVFHDSEKANGRMRYALPGVLQHFSKLGYSFKAMPPA